MPNFTVVAPNGANTHGSADNLCLPPQWHDYVLFFLTNYVAHAVTVIAEPGQSTLETIYWTLNAMFLPAAGLVRTLPYLLRRPGFEKDPLKRAALSGALCTVVKIREDVPYRYGWNRKNLNGIKEHIRLANKRMLNKDSDLKYGCDLQDPGMMWVGLFEDVSNIQSYSHVCESKTGRQIARWEAAVFPRLGKSMETKVAGICHVPKGFQLIVVPADTPLKIIHEKPPHISKTEWRKMVSERELPSSYSVPKLVVTLLQALYAITTLYQARGNQIEFYGHAAFGLTVAPYAIMTVINAATNVVAPNYTSMYLVSGPDMDEARKCGGIFDNIVAEIDLHHKMFPIATYMDKYAHVVPSYRRWGTLVLMILLFTLAGLPLIVVGSLSRFEANASTQEQRGWTMAWLATSLVVSLWLGRANLFYSFFYVPAIGGMVTVGLQLRDYGICTSLDNVSIA